jgi:hypothetical protein
MKINYHKSDLMYIYMEREECLPFLQIFKRVDVSLRVKYLGLPSHFNNLRREDLQPLVDSLWSRMT